MTHDELEGELYESDDLSSTRRLSSEIAATLRVVSALAGEVGHGYIEGGTPATAIAASMAANGADAEAIAEALVESVAPSVTGTSRGGVSVAVGEPLAVAPTMAGSPTLGATTTSTTTPAQLPTLSFTSIEAITSAVTGVSAVAPTIEASPTTSRETTETTITTDAPTLGAVPTTARQAAPDVAQAQLFSPDITATEAIATAFVDIGVDNPIMSATSLTGTTVGTTSPGAVAPTMTGASVEGVTSSSTTVGTDAPTLLATSVAAVTLGLSTTQVLSPTLSATPAEGAVQVVSTTGVTNPTVVFQATTAPAQTSSGAQATGVAPTVQMSPETVSALATTETIATAPTMVTSPTQAFQPEEEWYDEAWDFRKPVTIQSSQVSSEHTNFPVLVNITGDSDLASGALNNGDDILFTSDDGTTQLDHEIESFDGSAGDLWAWVRIPTLSATTDTELFVYYGNGNASNQENIASVWNADYGFVHHLDEGGGQAIDSTANNFDSQSNSASFGANGQIASGYEFDGDSTVNFDGAGNAPGHGSTELTMTVWVSSDTANSDRAIMGTITGTGNDNSTGVRYDVDGFAGGQSNVIKIGVQNQGGTNAAAETAANTQTTSQQMIAVTWETGGAFDTYLDGSVASYSAVPASLTGSVNLPDWYIGAGQRDGGSSFWDGIIDEIRVSSVTRSSDWIQTRYNNESSPGTFVSVGTEEQNAVQKPVVAMTPTAATPTDMQVSSPVISPVMDGVTMQATASTTGGPTRIWYQNQAPTVLYEDDGSGSIVSSFEGIPSFGDDTFGVAHDTSGCIWSVEGLPDDIAYQYTQEGSLVQSMTFEMPDGRGPASIIGGVHLDPDNSIWVELNDYTPSGKPDGMIDYGKYDQNGCFVSSVILNKQTSFVPDISQGSTGSIWGADHNDSTIFKIDLSGTTLSSFSTPSDSVGGVGLDRENSLWHIDNNADSLYLLNTSGSVIQQTGTADDLPVGTATTDEPVTSSVRIEGAWTDNADNEEGFNVYRATGTSPSFPDDYIHLKRPSANSSVFVDKQTPVNSSVWYAVTAYNTSGGESSAVIDVINTT